MSSSIWAPGEGTFEVNAEGTLVNEVFTTLAGQTLFNLTAFTYVTGNAYLGVFRNGQKLVSGVDYSETSSTSFTLLIPVAAGETIEAVGLIGSSSLNSQLASQYAASALASKNAAALSETNADLSEAQTFAYYNALITDPAVSNVYASLSAVNNVDFNLTAINNVDGNMSDVVSVSNNMTRITAVGSNSANINTVAANTTNINTVAGNNANISAVASNATNINEVNANSANINTVATNNASITTTAANITSINNVAANATNINSVAANQTDIDTVAGNTGNITAVANNTADIDTVATNIAAVNNVSTNMVAVLGAAGNASAAAASAAAADSYKIQASAYMASAQSYRDQANTAASNALGSANQAAASAANASQIVLGVASARPSIRPSLLLDFANTKVLDPRITFSRASTATFYDGKTVAKAEENLLTYSQEFDGAGWPRNNLTVIANATLAPDGTTTADQILLSAGTLVKAVYKGTVNAPFTASVYIKADSGVSYIQMYCNGDVNTQANFDISTGVVGTKGSSVASSSIQNVGSGWYRLSMSVSSPSAFTIFIGVVDSASASWNAATSVTGSFYIWGAQLEQRSSVTAYTPTTTQPITNYIPALQTAAANVARFDHDPVTGESKGLLIEEQRTNLLTYSDQFDNVAWTKNSSTITANTIVAPDGTLTADTFTASAAYGNIVISTPTAGTSFTVSVFAKAGSFNGIELGIAASGGFVDGVAVRFDLSSGTYVSQRVFGSGYTVSGYSITPVGNNWYRISVSGSLSVSAAPYPWIGATVSGVSGSSFHIWGAQLEAGAFPTSYIPTTTSQVTRSADSASMTGSNFSSWYRADEGTVYVEAGSNMLPATSQSNFAPYFISDGSSQNIIAIRSATGYSPNRVFPLVTYNNTNVFTGEGSGYITTPVLSAKIALAYKLNDFANSFNGASPYTDSSGNIPVVSQLDIGKYGSSIFDGTIKRIAYYPKRLSNTELQALTS